MKTSTWTMFTYLILGLAFVPFSSPASNTPIGSWTVVPVVLPTGYVDVRASSHPLADWDGDGDLDFVATGQQVGGPTGDTPFTGIALHDGNGRFSLRRDDLFPGIGAAADFDRDGDLDMVIGGSLFRNRGDATFVAEATTVPHGDLMSADIDGDGDPDAVLRWRPELSATYELRVLRNNGGRFSGAGDLLEIAEFGVFHLGDWDLDGDPDILHGNHYQGSLRLPDASAHLFLNSGDGFFPPNPLSITNVAFSQIGQTWVADDDGDGDLDLVTYAFDLGPTGPGYFRIENSGRAEFSSVVVPHLYGQTMVDFDHDGDMDTVASVYLPDLGVSRWHLVENTGIGTGTPVGVSFGSPPLLGDLDGDGDVDFLGLTRNTDPAGPPEILVILRNDSNRANRAPAAPAGLGAIPETGDRTRLSWAAPADDHTPPQSLNYALRVGTSPGASDVVSAEPTIARFGMGGTATVRGLYRLPAGTYFWSVRAFDGQFQAGPWAPEQSFVVGSDGLQPIADVVTPPGITSKPIQVMLGTSGGGGNDNIGFTAESDSPELLPASSFAFTGTGSSRVLTITPLSRVGSAQVSVRATRANAPDSIARFRVTVAFFGIADIAKDPVQRNSWAVADWDSDGDLDVLGGLSRFPSLAGVRWLRNDGVGGLSLNAHPLPAEFPGVFVPGDWNGDGVTDVLGLARLGDFNDLARYPVRLWSGIAGFAIDPSPVDLTATTAVRRHFDADLDGVVDLLSWGAATDISQRQDARVVHPTPASWRPPGLAGAGTQGIAWGDFDADGDLDAVISESVPQRDGSSAIRNRCFWFDAFSGYQEQDCGLPADALFRIGAFDYDQDGWLDLFLATPIERTEGPASGRLFRNAGNRTFVPAPVNLPPRLTALPAWGDFDNDGDPDLLLVSDADRISEPTQILAQQLWRNDGSSGFSPVDMGIPRLQANEAFWADFDRNGVLDLFLAGADAGGVLGQWICAGTTVRTNTPPPAPSGLRVIRVPAGPRLSWNETRDPETSGRLTYNLRVGTAPGLGDVVSPLADSVSGRRRISGPGNVGPLLLRQLGNLTNGTYFWSVQAVDAGYAASAFATEEQFTVSRPTLEVATQISIPPNRTSDPMAFKVGDVETPADQLRVVFTSIDPVLLPESGIVVSGSGSSRSLTFRPAPGRAGVGMLVLGVEDLQGERTSSVLRVEVLPEFAAVASSVVDFLDATAEWGDADLDGDLDLLLGGGANTNLSGGAFSAIFENQSGTVGTTYLDLLPSNPMRGNAHWVDMDRDGRLDVFSTGGFGIFGDASLFHADADRRWPAVPDTTFRAIHVNNSAAAWGDMDGDGAPDLALMGTDTSFDSRTIVYRNQGGLRLDGFPFAISPSYTEGALEWVDIDSDGDNDLVISGLQKRPTRSTPSTEVLVNTDGALRPLFVDLPGVHQSCMAVADYDLDGDPDLIVAGESESAPITQLLRNEGNYVFTRIATPLPGIRLGSIAWADANGDGRPDLALAGDRAGGASTTNDPVSSIWYNLPDGWTQAAVNLPGAFRSAVAWGDMDGDGRIDLALAGNTGGENFPQPFTELYRNDIAAVTPPPPVPTELRISRTGSDVILQWKVPEGGPRGISFNLRVGTAPGLADIVQAQADPATGRLRWARQGNAGWSGTWRLRKLNRGSYYWSVQSIDPAYRGSAFAPEATFDVVNAPPTLTSIPDQTAPMNAPFRPTTGFAIADPDGALSQVLLSGTSSNPDLIPDSGIAFAGTGAIRNVTLTPRRNVAGDAIITVIARDALGGTAETRFRIAFVPMTTTPQPSLAFNPVALVPVDYNRDGYADLLYSGFRRVGGTEQAFTAIFPNRAFTGFTSASVQNLPTDDPHPAWADAEGDGDPDIHLGGGLIKLTGSTFTVQELLTAPNVRGAWGDADADGDFDLALVGVETTYASIHRNGGATFESTNPGLVAVAAGAAAWQDFDGDDDLDIAISGRASQLSNAPLRVTVYRNDRGRFEPVYEELGAESGFLQWGDINRDGRPDLLISGRRNGEAIERTLLNLGDGSFQAVQTTAEQGPSVPLANARWIDVDNDGDLDLVEHATGNPFQVRLNNGFGEFSATPVFNGSNPVTLLREADFDRDGDFDFVIAGRSSGASVGVGTTLLVWNHWTNNATAVATLQSVVDRSDVDLQWPSVPASSQTSSNTYNLRVGRTPGGSEVVPAMSDPQTGRRRIPTHGNMGYARSTRLRALAPGQYYWSVQAVDPSWNGAPFAPEATFTIQNVEAPPRLEAWRMAELSTLELGLAGEPHRLALLEFSVEPGFGTWRHHSQVRLDPTGRKTVRLPSTANPIFYRMRVVP